MLDDPDIKTQFHSVSSAGLEVYIKGMKKHGLYYYINPREGEAFYVQLDKKAFLKDLKYHDMSKWNVRIIEAGIQIG